MNGAQRNFQWQGKRDTSDWFRRFFRRLQGLMRKQADGVRVEQVEQGSHAAKFLAATRGSMYIRANVKMRVARPGPWPDQKGRPPPFRISR
jgi:hypothetical protein